MNPVLFRSAVIIAVIAAPISLPAELGVGAKAPDFSEALCDARGLTGEDFNLARDGAGKVVYLQFDNPSCASVKYLIGNLENDVCPIFSGNDGVSFVQIAYAYGGYGADDVARMVSDTGCTQNVLAEEDGSTYAAYDLTRIPYCFIIDAEGVIRYSKSGRDASTGEIAAAIRELLSPAPAPQAHIEVVCDKTAYRAGDAVVIAAEISDVGRPFDAYALVRKPDGSFLSILPGGAFADGVAPFAAGVPSHRHAGAYELLNTVIPPGAPTGVYEAIVCLTDPGALGAFREARCAAPVR